MWKARPPDDRLTIEQATEILRYELDAQRLRLDETTASRESRFFTRNFSALLAAAIAFAGSLVSGASIYVAFVTNKNATDIAAKKDLREFVALHRTELFGTDRTAADQLRRTLEITFPPKLATDALDKIAPKAPAETRDIFSTANSTGRIIRGKIGTWGGPNDAGISPHEGLALIKRDEVAQFQEYFLPAQPSGTTGLARRLDPSTYYISARWDFNLFPQNFLKTHKVTVTNPRNGQSAQAQPVDWGPLATTGLVADLSPGLANTLGLSTDDEAIITIPSAAHL